MKIDQVFCMGEKLIFAGDLKEFFQPFAPRSMVLIADGLILCPIQIEGEIYDNTREVSVWGKTPASLSISDLKDKVIELVPQVSESV